MNQRAKKRIAKPTAYIRSDSDPGDETEFPCSECDGTGAIEKLDSGVMLRFGLRPWNGCEKCGGNGNDIRGTGRVSDMRDCK